MMKWLGAGLLIAGAAGALISGFVFHNSVTSPSIITCAVIAVVGIIILGRG
jgi:hypothetical protein